jgi:hypothetical protein
MDITTTIINTTNNTQAGRSTTATQDDPCRDHTADIGEDVYEQLEDSWSGTIGSAVSADGTTYEIRLAD